MDGLHLLSFKVLIFNVIGKLSTNINTVAVIAGLLLSSVIPLMISPPSSFTNLSQNDSALNFYFFFMIIPVTVYFVSITTTSNFFAALNTSAGEADRMRLIIRRGKIPTIIYTCFSIDNLAYGAATVTIV